MTQIRKNATYLLVFFALIAGCVIPEAPEAFTGDEQFRTTEPSRLYFRNMRSSYYDTERKANSKIDLYTLRRFSKDKNRAILYPVIVSNWLEDEAYIFIETNDFPGLDDPLTLKWESDNTQVDFQLAVRNKADQYEFAGKIYKALLNKHQLLIRDENGNWVPLFDNRADKLNFLSTMRDYYRLTEVF